MKGGWLRCRMDFYLTGEVVSLVDVCILGGLEL